MLLRATNGVTIDATDVHARLLKAAGWTPVAEETPETVDFSALTVATLRALCEERGIEAPKRATKAQLIELLGGMTP